MSRLTIKDLKRAIKEDIRKIKKKDYIDEDFTVKQNKEVKEGLIEFGNSLLDFLEEPFHDYDKDGKEQYVTIVELRGELYYCLAWEVEEEVIDLIFDSKSKELIFALEMFFFAGVQDSFHRPNFLQHLHHYQCSYGFKKRRSYFVILRSGMELETPEGIKLISLRSLFDALCAECVGGKQGAYLVDEIIRQKQTTFDQIVIEYLATLKPRTFYYLEGFIAAIYGLMHESKPARDWVLSYSWELLILFKPFDKKDWPTRNLYDILEKQMHTIVDEARIIEKAERRRCSR